MDSLIVQCRNDPSKNENDHSELVSTQCGRQSEPGLFSFVPLYIMCEKLNEKPCHVCQSFSKSPMTFDARRRMTIIHPQMWPNTFCFCHIAVDDTFKVHMFRFLILGVLDFGFFGCRSIRIGAFYSFILIINSMQENMTSASGL